MEKRLRGRPISVQGRKKIGLSLTKECADNLTRLAKEYNVTKSEFAKIAINLYYVNYQKEQEILKAFRKG